MTGERAPGAPSPQGRRFAFLRAAPDGAIADFVCFKVLRSKAIRKCYVRNALGAE